MKCVRVMTAGIFLLLGTMAPVVAQRDGDKQGDSGKEEKGQPQQQKQAQPQQQKQAQPQRAQQPQQQKQAQPQRAQQPQQQKEAQPQRAQQPQQQKEAQPQRAQQPQQQQPQRAQQPQQQQPQHAQQPQQQQPQRAQQPQQQQPQRAQQPQQQQPQRAQGNYQPPQRPQQQARTWQQQKGWAKQGAWQGGTSWQQDRARNWASDHRTWAQRGGYGGFYIPQATFGIYFGPQHYFRLRTRPVMYMGYPRFDYGGYSFLLLDPWPEYWSDNWYDADDLYINYDPNDGGYYLYNRMDPQVRLAVMPLA